MPFAGTVVDARRAMSSLLRIELRKGDELIVADNSAAVPQTPGVSVVSALGERSPAHARNAGAARAGGDFVLFLDSDCVAPPDLLDSYLADPVGGEVGALAGEVVPAPGTPALASRYATARRFLRQEAHLAHPYRPRAVAANLLVRRTAFVRLGGFFEGLRAAEDTDFCWRLQEAGWRLELRAGARVEHRYRSTLPELRRQWRGYAAGRAWLARRYEGFEPRPALWRAIRRAAPGSGAPRGAPATEARRSERVTFLALDALLALDELAGFAQSNRPTSPSAGGLLSPGGSLSAAGSPSSASARVEVVIVADRFPAPEEGVTITERVARVEAVRRPGVVDLAAARAVPVDYREDDGAAARVSALAQLVIRHPVRCALDVRRRRPGEPGLMALAPATLRLARDPDARVRAIGGHVAHAAARRLAALTGSPLEPASAS
jgi:GT2 family glycosyltransferase